MIPIRVVVRVEAMGLELPMVPVWIEPGMISMLVRFGRIISVDIFSRVIGVRILKWMVSASIGISGGMESVRIFLFMICPWISLCIID